MIPTILFAAPGYTASADEQFRRDRLHLTGLMFAEGWRVVNISSPEQLLSCLSDGRALSLLLLDKGILPTGDVAFLSQLRALTDLPILLLADQADQQGQLVFLETGIDAVLTRPVHDEMVIAHMKNLLRRFGALSPREIICGGLRVSNAEHVAETDGQPVALTPKEFDLLYYLMQNPNRALTRYQILYGAWGVGRAGEERTVDGHIKSLRSKLGAYGCSIVTVRSVGYKFSWEEKSASTAS